MVIQQTEHGLQQMVAIIAATGDMQKQVNFGWRWKGLEFLHYGVFINLALINRPAYFTALLFLDVYFTSCSMALSSVICHCSMMSLRFALRLRKLTLPGNR